MRVILSPIIEAFLKINDDSGIKLKKHAIFVSILTLLLLIPTTTASPEWIKTYSGESMDYLNPTSMVQTNDGGFAIAVFGTLRRIDNVGFEGHFTTHDELQIFKIDSSGELQWKRGYEKIDDPNHLTPTIIPYENFIITQTTDKGYAIASSNGYLFWLVKTDLQGLVVWSKTYVHNDESSPGCCLNSMIQSNDGGFALAGSVSNSGSGVDFWLVKTDSKGSVLWEQTYNSGTYVDINGNEYPRDEEAKSLIQTQDGGYALAGSVLLYRASTSSFVTATWVVKTDTQGKQSWNKGFDLNNEPGFKQIIIQTTDKGYAIAGTENEHFCLLKIDSSSQMQWSKIYEDGRTNSPCCVVSS